MQTSPIVNSIPVATPAVPSQPATEPAKEPLVGGGVQGTLGDLIRAGAAGYQAAGKQESVAADKVAIHPFETVATATGLLKQKTANIKGVNKATSLLHTIGGFAMLILTSNVTSTLKSPGDTAVDLANRVADAIDGKQTAEGWSLGWGVRAPSGDQEAAAAPVSGIGAALRGAGMQ